MSELKYKEGDKVLIKSIDWYNKYKDEDGDVLCGEFVFLKDMKKFCSETLTISADVDDGYLMFEDDHGYVWTDEMFEKLVERNGKTYPYKVGDRVVLKGNNRCATITDLKYNSWGNLSYYIKIDNDKDISIDYPTDLLLPYDNKIKGFIEEETIPIPKFKVGDKITNGKVTLTILTLSLDRYVVEDTFRKCGTLYFNSQDEWKIVGEEMKSEDELVDEYEELTDRAFKGGYEKCKSDIELNGFQLPEGYIFKDGNGNVINTNKIVLEKKKNDYPKTYEECSLINGCEGRISLSIIGKFTKLINARNAYWKIAGDEMGLGKPWSPDYSEESYEQGCPIKYVIYYTGTHITKERKCTPSYVLSFPTAEMRDAFYENFKKEIEECKELL